MLAFFNASFSSLGSRRSITTKPARPTPALDSHPGNDTSAISADKCIQQDPTTSSCVGSTLYSDLARSQVPLTYYLVPQTNSHHALLSHVPTGAVPGAEYTCDASPAPYPSDEITPILHPNEILLQRFPNKLAMKRGREHCRPSPKHVSLHPTAGTDSDVTWSAWILHNTSSGSLQADGHHPHINATGASAAPQSEALREEKQAESHELLRKNLRQYGTRGTIYVTSERILFVPNPQKYFPASAAAPSLEELEFEIWHLAIDAVKVLESGEGKSFFVCYDGSYITTIPFKNALRAHSFLKLVSNIRFEQMIRQSLPPKYETPSQACCQGGQRPQCESCATLDLADWNAEDNVLPSYIESEEAVRQYLITLRLISQDLPFDRANPSHNVVGLLTQALLPPNIDEPISAMPEHRQSRSEETPRRRVTRDQQVYSIPLA